LGALPEGTSVAVEPVRCRIATVAPPHVMTVQNEGVRGFVSWTTPAEIVSVVHRRWTRGDLLAARVTGETLFPLALPLRRPHSSLVGDRFDELQRWIRSLERESRACRGSGYDIRWVEVESRRAGRVRIPSAVVIPSAEDALQLIGKGTEAARFDTLARRTLKFFPQLRGWLSKNSLRALRSAPQWDHLITLVAWFQAHPRPQVYLRQIDLPGVDVAFIEEHRGLLADLLNEVLPEEAIDRRATNVREFERRFGLLSAPPPVRLRILDSHQSINGLTDITLPAAQLATLCLRPARIFVTESEINGLAFPEMAESIVIFGLRYDDDRLAEVPWLRGRPLHYWGDIGASGFASLDRMRASFPETVSFLMDRGTFLAHQRSWGTADDDERPTTELSHLSKEELALFHELLDGRFETGVRLDQADISYRWVRRALERL
jgi:hypothetical protein